MGTSDATGGGIIGGGTFGIAGGGPLSGSVGGIDVCCWTITGGASAKS